MSCMLTGKSQKSTHHLFFLRHVMMLRKRYIRSCKDLRNNLVQAREAASPCCKAAIHSHAFTCGVVSSCISMANQCPTATMQANPTTDYNYPSPSLWLMVVSEGEVVR